MERVDDKLPLVTIGRDRRVSLPASILEAAGLEAGDLLAVDATSDGVIVLKPADPLLGHVGSMTGMYSPGYLDTLRDEWER